MSLANVAAFGGTLKIGGKEYTVRGRTYRKIAEQQSWWLSQCFCPITELRRFLYSNSLFLEKDFIEKWLKIGRKSLITNTDVQREILSTFSARRFDIWQSCREDGLRLEELDDHLDSMSGLEIADFLEEADLKMSIANGVGELDYLTHCYSRNPSGGGTGRPVESMIAQVCVRNKNRMSLEEVLDSTPAALRTIFEDPETMVDDAEAERSLHPNDKLGQKRFSRIYESMADNIVEGRRIDSERPKEKKA